MEQARRAGYEPDGEYLIGRDPREMTRAELEAIGHEPMSPLEALRAKCLDCAGSAHEVRCCVAMACPSWPFRTRANPWRAPPTEAQIEARRQAALRLRGSADGASLMGAADGRPSGVSAHPRGDTMLARPRSLSLRFGTRTGRFPGRRTTVKNFAPPLGNRR